MKYLLTLIIVLILQTASAQTKSKTSKPTSKNTKINNSGSQWTPSSQNVKPTPTIVLPDTTIDVSVAKWAVVEMYDNSPFYSSNNQNSFPSLIWVVFDNGIKINLHDLFQADTNFPKTQNAYVMAAFEYMYRHGFTVVSTYQSSETNKFVRYIFKGK